MEIILLEEKWWNCYVNIYLLLFITIVLYIWQYTLINKMNVNIYKIDILLLVTIYKVTGTIPKYYVEWILFYISDHLSTIWFQQKRKVSSSGWYLFFSFFTFTNRSLKAQKLLINYQIHHQNYSWEVPGISLTRYVI